MGKYIKKFDTHSDYEDFIETEDFIRPNVSYCVDNKDVHYNSTQTLFALEIESGEFISFYFQSGTLYANTDDGLSALWVLDDDGVVTDNISYSISDRAPILEQINEHYGTSFTGWSDNEIALSYGNTLPNWNVYEKIEMPRPINVKICIDPTPYDELYAYGYILDGTLNLIALTESPTNAAQVRENGNVSGAVTNKTLEQIMQMVETYTVTQVKLEGTINYGSTVQSWEDYELVN